MDIISIISENLNRKKVDFMKDLEIVDDLEAKQDFSKQVSDYI